MLHFSLCFFGWIVRVSLVRLPTGQSNLRATVSSVPYVRSLTLANDCSESIGQLADNVRSRN